MDQNIFDKPRNVMELATENVITITQATKVVDCLRSMVDHNFRRIPIVDEKGKIQGIISATDLVSFLSGKHKLVNEKYRGDLAAAVNADVEEIMEKNVVAVKNTDTWPDALELMVENEVGGCPVVDEQRTVIGIITERDILRFLAAHTELKGRVSFYMTKNVLTASSNDSVGEIMRTMISKGFRRVPITDGDVFTGIVTTREILRYFGEESFDLLTTGKIEKALKEPIGSILRNPLRYREPLFCDPLDRIANVSQVMLEKNYGVALVGKDDETVEGILTEKDIMKFLYTKIFLPSWWKSS